MEWIDITKQEPKKFQRILGYFDNNEPITCNYISKNKQIGNFKRPIKYKLLKWKEIHYEFGYWR